MEKIDMKKQMKALYSASTKKIEIVETSEMRFLMIDGAGDPNAAEAFHQGVEALYSLAYTVKFMVKKGPEALDFAVMPLEGLWWVEDMTRFSMDRKDEWLWTLMIAQPDFVTEALVVQAGEAAGKKKDLPALGKIRLEPFFEGRCAQTLHVGPFSEEPATIERLHAFIRAEGFRPYGKHHEIYLSDPRRTAPEKLKTILRQPVLIA